jgi:hypothetical protein
MSDTSPFGFGRFIPGFDFLQNLAKGASVGMSVMPSLSGWVAPTVNVEELDKRIHDFKAVQFWLEQNARAIAAAVQALEVQRMTLSTLRGMNVALGDVADAFSKGVQTASASTAQAMEPGAFKQPHPPADADARPAPANGSAGEHAPSAAGNPGIVDAMQWWGSLFNQFQQIAATAMQDAAPPPRAPEAPAPETRTTAARQPAAKSAAPAKKAAGKTAAKTAAKTATKTAARKTTPREK